MGAVNRPFRPRWVLSFAGGLAVAISAQAQQQLERVEITGSSIRRIDAESALPVQVIKKEDIARSGATSVVDLLQRLSYVQGSFNESSAVGGGAGGVSTVSLHNLGDARTLVLLNGHRMAQFGGQTLTGFGAAMDLNALPLAAIERIEILTDGASALYGADAIAGVINFITRRNTDEGDISVGFSFPRGGAREKRVSATKGFGSLEQDGFNVMLSMSRDERTRLDSTKRKYGNSAEIKFNHAGKSYRVQQITAAAIPANAYHDNGTPADPNDPNDPNWADDYLFNPYREANGVCPDKTFLASDFGDYCAFNFVGELEVYPARKRDSILASVNFKIGDQTPYVDLLYSESTQNSRIAPVPGTVPIALGSALHNTYLAPYGVASDSEAYYRIYDLGNRSYEDKSKFLDFSLGSKGLLAGWDYNAYFAHSQSESIQNIAGLPGALAVARAAASGDLNPFVGPGQQSAAGMAALNAINYKGYWDGGISKLDTAGVRASRELLTLSAGPLMLGAGASFQRESFQSRPSLYAQGRLSNPVTGALCDPSAPSGDPDECDQRFGDQAQSIAYSSSRNSFGVFGELIAPAAKGLEFITSVRWDHYDDFGGATTAKGGFRWTPNPMLMVRGSIGTGFRAPTVPQVNAPQQVYGVTGSDYTCTPEMLAIAVSLGATCRPGTSQYDVVAAGNTELRPEKTRQRSLGIRFEPGRNVTLGADLWYAQIRNNIGQLTEEEVFANPQAYSDSWTTKTQAGTGNVYLAWLADNKNLGTDSLTGLDVDATGRLRLPFADLTSRFALTYMIREQRQLTQGGRKYSAIGGGDESLGYVTFRWLGSWANTFQHGRWAHTFTGNFRSGYLDASSDVQEIDASGNPVGAPETIRIPVKRYVTLDWQTQWTPRKDFMVTVGLLNVFDTRPPLAISSGGLNRGQQFGYDDRYYDSRGRTAYLNASYKF
ncbi:MAG: TonB-dependent receptor [Rhizobacter sp.]